MEAILENCLREQLGMAEPGVALAISKAIFRKLRRNEPLLRAGEICRHKVFVASGMLRTYTIKADGSEHILQFSPEYGWAVDAESFNRQTPARYHIRAVENSEIIMWTKADFEELVNDFPELKAYSETIISQDTYAILQRLATMLSDSPEEKYDDFIQSFPGFLSRLPLWMIAAYLGVSLKTLNRIRRVQLMR